MRACAVAGLLRRGCLSGLRCLLRLNRIRLNGLLRCYRHGRLSRLLRLSSLSCVTRLSGQRSVLRGVCTGIVAVTTGCRRTLRRVVGSVLRH